MKVNEVRLGNLVNGIDGRFPIHRVSAIKGNVIETQPFSSLSWTSLFEGTGVSPYLTVVPFRITQDWLVRLGFKLESKEGELSLYSHTETNNFLHLNGNTAKFIFDSTVLLQMEYVHQLQNVFYILTGQELSLRAQ